MAISRKCDHCYQVRRCALHVREGEARREKAVRAGARIPRAGGSRMNSLTTSLLARLTAERERISRARHELARRDAVLAEAVTLLRTGRDVRIVEAMIEVAEDAMVRA